MSDSRPWITCHVLDTVAGKPAAAIDVTLQLISNTNSSKPFTATTNADGRVTSWKGSDGQETLEAAMSLETSNQGTLNAGQSSEQESNRFVWSLRFDTEKYYGRGMTFWPEVELRFATNTNDKHYHVPLLLGPWSYTTYRGS